MNFSTLFRLSLLALLVPFSLSAQEEEKEIPTEISQPPYEIGDLVAKQGYYIDQGGEGISINLRIVDNRLRVYWIDSDGLIAEPQHSSAIVRMTGSVRGRSYFSLKPLSGDAGLGSDGIVSPPHIFNMILVFPASEGGEPMSHSFRYTAKLDVVEDAEDTEDTETKNGY